MDIKNVGIVGAGTMGRGIAHLFAMYEYPVTLVDTGTGVLESAIKTVEKHAGPEAWKQLSDRLTPSTCMDDLRNCDLIIEAVFEEIEIKKEVFTALGHIRKDNAILATNTSAISIDKLADAVDDPSCFIGMHFMHPPAVMKLIEIIRGRETSSETIEVVTNLANALKKRPAVVNDSPGFVSNRLLFALIGEAMKLLDDGVAEKEDIDTVMKYGMNHPMGPIRLADFIGLDICRNIMGVLYDDLRDERYRPPAVLNDLIDLGKLGRKSGEGFYKYDGNYSGV